MRKYHNYIKETLLPDGSGLLLDFGCGHGGDIHKWVRKKVAHVIAIDPDAESILEAQRRSRTNANYLFFKDDLTFVRDSPERCVDVVTCHFVIHYFDKPQQLQLLQEFYRVLVDGGRVILTFMEGSRVFNFCRQEGKGRNSVIEINLDFPKITVNIPDTLYFKKKGNSEEFLVFQKFIQIESIKLGFKRCEISAFADYYLLYKGGILSKEEKDTSFLFAAVVLYK
jgi:ubiquinone/menaquinone biosynthesis C-methylase UbiE